MQSIHSAVKRPSSECADARAKKPKHAGAGGLCIAAKGRRHLFDLGAVLLASQQLSTLAEKALKRIAVTNLHCLVIHTVKNRPRFVAIAAYATEEIPIEHGEELQIPVELLPVVSKIASFTAL
ncbi:hypothetical protein AAVH_28993 [Aphelenchoides avenae]|nr:hypothetical protein AAVH_28993 [Aphelenchus avenae]